MIISKTPFRISFFGGGTDYPTWYREHGGAVVGTTIDKYCYLSVRVLPPFFEHKHRIIWSHIELVDEVDDIQHPAVRAILSERNITKGLEISYNADLPARSGLGSSSAFSVGLLNALNALTGRMTSKRELATEAIRVEQQVIEEAVGSQDQIWAAYGGFNRIDFHKDETHEVSAVILNPEERQDWQGSLMLFFTGFSRNAAEIAQKQIDNFDNKKLELRTLSALAEEATSIFQSKNGVVEEIGKLMHESWMLKRGLADGVTTDAVDEIYETGRAAGALGGKLLGAGGGGFMLFVVKKEDRPAVREALKDLIHVSFSFDDGGSKIAVFEPDELLNG